MRTWHEGFGASESSSVSNGPLKVPPSRTGFAGACLARPAANRYTLYIYSSATSDATSFPTPPSSGGIPNPGDVGHRYRCTGPVSADRADHAFPAARALGCVPRRTRSACAHQNAPPVCGHAECLGARARRAGPGEVAGLRHPVRKLASSVVEQRPRLAADDHSPAVPGAGPVSAEPTGTGIASMSCAYVFVTGAPGTADFCLAAETPQCG